MQKVCKMPKVNIQIHEFISVDLDFNFTLKFKQGAKL